MPIKLSLVTIFISSILFHENVWAWGKVGHESVAIIAEQQLAPPVKSRIAELLGNMSMATAANWPDKIKSDPTWAHASPYHYTGVSDGQDYWKQMGGLPPQKQNFGDVVRALVKAEDILRDSNYSDTEKSYALGFMIHLMGDLHQPLHTGRPEDRGGNDMKLLYFGTSTNLHAIWDVWIIGNIITAINSMMDPETSTETYMKQLRTPSAQEISSWKDSYIMDWLDESIQPRKAAYADMILPNDKYQDKYAPVVNERVLRGGYRLATWLNSIFTNEKFQETKFLQIRDNINKYYGKNSDLNISLSPKHISDSQRIYIQKNFPDYCGHHH